MPPFSVLHLYFYTHVLGSSRNRAETRSSHLDTGTLSVACITSTRRSCFQQSDWQFSACERHSVLYFLESVLKVKKVTG